MVFTLFRFSLGSLQLGAYGYWLVGWLLCKMPNLEKLHLFNSGHLLEEWSVPCLGTLLELKELELWDSEIKDLWFERYPVLQRLEYLHLSLLQIDQFSSSFGIINLLDIFGSTGLYWIEEFNGILNSQKSDST